MKLFVKLLVLDFFQKFDLSLSLSLPCFKCWPSSLSSLPSPGPANRYPFLGKASLDTIGQLPPLANHKFSDAALSSCSALFGPLAQRLRSLTLLCHLMNMPSALVPAVSRFHLIVRRSHEVDDVNQCVPIFM
jgi:hypothetical protein